MSSASMPPGWNKTHEDLHAEMKTGKRRSIVRAEMDWATQYEQSLLPADIRFLKVGEVYEAAQDIDVQFEIYFAAPVTNSGNGSLFKGERVKIKFISPRDKPIWAFAKPLRYRAVEKRFLPETQREPKYSHFYVVLKTVELHAAFRQVRTWTISGLARRLGFHAD